MDESQLAERIAQIRTRFMSKLTEKIQEVETSLPRLAGNGSDAVDAVAMAYRRFHDLSGAGPTLGFNATGRAARILDGILIEPFRDRRALTSDELAKLTEGIACLRAAARTEIGLKGSNQELVS